MTAAESRLSDDDLRRLADGTHHRLYEHLGAHVRGDDAAGASFAVWAPNADAVSVIGEFNDWDHTADPMTARGRSGVWEATVPSARHGHTYRYAVSGAHGATVEHADPFAVHAQTPPLNASRVWDARYDWGDDGWMAARGDRQADEAPMSIYEVHLGSWQRGEDGRRFLGYREIAPLLVAHAERLHVTHVEFLPVMEHPFYGSWGYQTTGYFAPTSRYGTPQDFKFLVDHLHRAGIGVILDWVPSHFPDDWWALASFDGTHLYDHADPRRGRHPDWNSAMFDYGRPEVRAFLLSSASYWLSEFHADGLRVDAVSSMLYLDHSRAPGEWEPNVHGGNEHLEAVDVLTAFNDLVEREHPGARTFAEEATAWPGVTRGTGAGGLGFSFKWDMGWTHDTLAYLRRGPDERPRHQQQLTFRSVYAANERFCLPLSHDEVASPAGHLLAQMPGDEWRQRANLRLLLGYQFTLPGKKIVMMGSEFGQRGPWDVEGQLDWGLLDDERHAGLLHWVADLAAAYRDVPALHRGDAVADGFAWVDASDETHAVMAWLRRAPRTGDADAPSGGDGSGDEVLVAANFLPTPRRPYRFGVPRGGRWREVLNSDGAHYGGTGEHGNGAGVQAVDVGWHGLPHAVDLVLPPLGIVVLAPDEA